MNLWVCPNCFRRSMKSENIKMSLCGCGEYMNLIPKEREYTAEYLVNDIIEKEESKK